MLHWTNSKDGEGSPSPNQRASWYAQGMSDGLGDRLLMFDNSAGPSLELLRFQPGLAHTPAFEAALREQVQRLAFFQHPAFARVRSVQRLEPDDDLALISNHTPGKRLSEVLHRARGPALATALVKQLAPALAQFQQHAEGVSHGLLSPDRIVVSPDGKLTIVEHVIGPAIEALDLPAAQLESMGIALPPAPLEPGLRLDVATDWYQLGLVALSVLIGRPVTASELSHLDALLDRLGEASGPSQSIREWLQRALRLSQDRIESGADACAALDELVHREPSRPSPAIERSTQERTQRSTEVPAASAPPSVSQQPAPPVAGVAPPEPPVSDIAPPAPPVVEPTPSIVAPRPAPAVAPTAPSAEDAPSPSRAIEDEAWAGRKLLLDLQERLAHEAPAAQAREPKAERGSVRRPIIAALALIVVVEAAVIAWLAKAVWAPQAAPIVAVSDPSGDGFEVDSSSTGPASLHLAVAPDLGWVRVTSPSTDGIVGSKTAGGTAGMVRISSPVPLKVLEGSRQLGTVPGADLKLAVGRHEIELVNAALGYSAKQVIAIEAGQTMSIHVAPAHGWVTVDAAPWADITIDGQPMGRTPLGPLPLAIGEHTITFKNPAGSNERQRITVKSKETVRVIGKLKF